MKILRRLMKKLLIFALVAGLMFSNLPFDILSATLRQFAADRNVVDKIWMAQKDGNVVDKFVPFQKIADRLRIYDAYAAVGDARMEYGQSTNAAPWTSFYTASSNSWNTGATTGIAGTANVGWTVAKESPTEDVTVVATQSSTGKLDIFCRTGSTWTKDIANITIGTTAATRRFDVEFEKTSGVPMVLYSTNTATTNELSYYRKTSAGCGAGSWTGPTVLNPTRVTGIVLWVELEARQTASSNVLAAAFSDASATQGGILESMIWNASWGNESPATAANGWSDSSIELQGTAGANAAKVFDLAFETTSGDLLVAWGTSLGTATVNGWRYATCSATLPCTWSAVQTPAGPLDDATNVACAPDPGSNAIACIAQGNAGNDLTAWLWSGTAVGATTAATADATLLAAAAGDMHVDIDWVVSGTQRMAVGVYAETTTGVRYIYYDTVGAAWRTNTTASFTPTGAPATALQSVQVLRNPSNAAQLLTVLTDANSDLISLRLIYNGAAGGATTALSTWNASTGSPVELTVSSITSQPFWFDWARVAPADTSPPTPNPMTFATTPTNYSPTQISATSTTGSDAATPPVNYLFTLNNTNCGANAGTGGASSSWQSSVAYSNSGLQPNKCYGYTITARDSVTPTPNTGTASAASSTYTSANTPGTPILNGATASTLNLTNAENSNPASNPTTNFAVQVVTTSPSDATWLNQWVNATGNPSATAVWLTDAQLDALVLQGLQVSTIYGVKVKAKNQDNDETALSAEGQGTTLAPAGPDATSYSNTETTLNYSACATTGCGGRISQTITISGTSLGSAVTNKDTCTAGAANGCVRIGNYTVPAASISTWTDTQIVFSAPAGITVFGGSGTTCGSSGSGVCVTQNGNNDAGGALEFWVFPNITSVSPSGAGEGKEGDTITITGTRFDTSAATGTVVFQNCGTGDVSATVSTWSDTSAAVTVPSGIADNDDACDIKLTRAAGTGSKTASSTNFVVLPQIDSVAAIAANAGRTYAAGDTDGLIMLIGTHFGAAGSVTVLGSSGVQHATAEGQCSFGGWRATTTCREVPNAAGYTGNIVLTRSADSKSHTYAGTFRILPRITGITPGSGAVGDSFTLSGNHFCQNGGACPSVFDASNKITFNGGATTTDFFAWTGASASSSVPSAASTGNVTITSNTYVSNGINFTVL
ncbi:MAG: IPT/TIG domain-containing protein, partial [Patescibacteria group bacterium]